MQQSRELLADACLDAIVQGSNAQASLGGCLGVPVSALLPPGYTGNPPRGSMRAVLTVRMRLGDTTSFSAICCPLNFECQ